MWSGGDIFELSGVAPPPMGDKVPSAPSSCSLTNAATTGFATRSAASTVASCNSSVSSGLLQEPPRPTKRVGKQLARTQLCKHHLRGFCRYKDNCAYAHCTDELVPRPNLQRTKICISFLSGVCRNSNCSYAHGIDELREVNSVAAGNTFNCGSPESISSFAASSTHGSTFAASPDRFDTLSGSGCSSRSATALQHDVAPSLTAKQRELDVVASQPLQPPRKPSEAANMQRADVLGMNNGVARGGERRDPKDTILLNELLSEIALLLRDSAQDGDSAHGVPVPARAVTVNRWAKFTKNVIVWWRRKCQVEGQCLLSYSKRSEDLSRVEEHMLTLMLFRDQYWASVFPGLMQRCSSILTAQLATSLDAHDTDEPNWIDRTWNFDKIHGRNKLNTSTVDPPGTPQERVGHAVPLQQNIVHPSHQRIMRQDRDDSVMEIVPPPNLLPVNLAIMQQREPHSQEQHPQQQRYRQKPSQLTQQLLALQQNSQTLEESLPMLPSPLLFSNTVSRSADPGERQAAPSAPSAGSDAGLDNMWPCPTALQLESMVPMSL